jgi:hypothetical protein
MRPSTTSTRASHAPGSQAPPSATLLARLADKKKEIEAVEALQRASTLFLRRLEGLADDCEAMADAGIGACMYTARSCVRAWLALAWSARRAVYYYFLPSVVPVTDLIFGGSGTLFVAVHGQVLAQWPQMFRTLVLFGTCVPICV